MRSDPEAGRRLLAEGLEVHPDSGWLYYAVACLEAVQCNREAAFGALGKAIELRPRVAEVARDHEDLASLRDDPEFRALTALP